MDLGSVPLPALRRKGVCVAEVNASGRDGMVRRYFVRDMLGLVLRLGGWV
jgi:hypothetical protein